MRTLRITPCASLLNSWPPHVEQKHFSKPSSGFHPLTSSSPCTKRSEPGSIRACGEAAVPVRRWQRVQWQYVIETSGFVIS
jgi:hypothetical protein